MKKKSNRSDASGVMPTSRPRHLLWLLLPLMPALLSPLVLREDWLHFLVWWAVITLPALIWVPSCARLFGLRADAGFLFSKPLALAVSSLIVWTLSYLHWLPFSRTTILLVLAAGLTVNLLPPRSRKTLLTLVKNPIIVRRAALGEFLFGAVQIGRASCRERV